MIFPIHQSCGKVPVDNDCEKSADENGLCKCLVLFDTLELILSNLADEDTVKQSVMFTMPDVVGVM